MHANFKMDESRPLDATEYIPELFNIGIQRAEENFLQVKDRFFDHQRQQFTPITSAEEEVKLEEFGFQ